MFRSLRCPKIMFVSIVQIHIKQKLLKRTTCIIYRSWNESVRIRALHYYLASIQSRLGSICLAALSRTCMINHQLFFDDLNKRSLEILAAERHKFKVKNSRGNSQ